MHFQDSSFVVVILEMIKLPDDFGLAEILKLPMDAQIRDESEVQSCSASRCLDSGVLGVRQS